jgi:hypothetical protein
LKELEKYLRETILLLSMNKLLHLIDDEFQSQNAAKCDLLIHLGFESIQYAIIDKVRDELKALVEYELDGTSSPKSLIEAIESLPECNKEFKYPFNKVKISFDSYLFTFIPQELYVEADLYEYAKYIESTHANDVLAKPIAAANIQNVFKINSDLHLKLKNIFGEAIILNQANAFIQGIIKNYPQGEKSALIIDIHQKHIQIAHLEHSKLAFYNIFDCMNADELNYFLLNCIETLKINVQDCSMMLSGKVVKGDESYQRIEKYFGDIQFADAELIVRHPEKFNEVLRHQFFSLISLDQCE